MADEQTQVSALLQRMRNGDSSAADELYSVVYPHLRRLAKAVRAGWSGDHTLSATAIINEAYLKLSNDKKQDWKDRAHFFRVAARAMGQVLLNYRAGKEALKRPDNKDAVEFDEARLSTLGSVEDLVATEQALQALEQLDPRTAQVFECRRLAGLTILETAEALNISASTVKREAQFVETWLYNLIAGDGDEEAAGAA